MERTGSGSVCRPLPVPVWAGAASGSWDPRPHHSQLIHRFFKSHLRFLLYRRKKDGSPKNSLIVESGDRNTYVSYEDIYEYSYSSDYSSYDVSFAGESSLTSAIDYVLSDTLPKLYTLTGHGEDDLSTSFQSAVEQQNIEVADLSLLTEESVPEDADCLLINGPDSDLSQDEAEAIQAYLDTGGDLIVLTDPAQDGQDLTNLEALMGEYGMTANDGVVIEGDTANYALGAPSICCPIWRATPSPLPSRREDTISCWPWPRGSRWRRAPGTASP